jgi:BolA protein
MSAGTSARRADRAALEALAPGQPARCSTKVTSTSATRALATAAAIFALDIVSDAVRGRGAAGPPSAHYEALGTLMQSDIHALSISARTPAEVR